MNHESRDSRGIDYRYEEPLLGPNGTKRIPDFTIDDDESGIRYYWEHLGLLHLPEYRERWEKKVTWYRKLGVLPYEEGGGPVGTLITTRDSERGGISSQEIEALAERVLHL